MDSINRVYGNSSDDGVTDAAIQYIKQGPSFMFIQLDAVRNAGDTDGYNSTNYLAAAAATDKYVGMIVEALQRYLPNEYIVCISFFY